MLEIRNLTKNYGSFKAVDNLSLTIPNGTIYGFIGHNGAGKTTTLKSVVGILPFEQGEILIDGISLKENPLGCKQILAYIPDNPDLYDYLTGIQYITFICDIYKIPETQRQERIKKYATLVGIYDQLDNLISSYSHGMKQKIAIISAFVHEPKLLIMDEPFVGLDPKTSKDLKDLMKEYCARGNSIFFSTHVLEVAQILCDSIAIIKEGKLIVSGNTQEITKDESLEDFFLDLVEDHVD